MTNTSQPTQLDIRLPGVDESIDQDEEWCEVYLDGDWRRIRFHDYDEIYSIPGLYERLFYEVLECDSPRTLRSLIEEELDDIKLDASKIKAMDLGAGNGMMGEQLKELGIADITAIDIVPEAAKACERDRPGIYADYVIADLTDPHSSARTELRDSGFNCLTSVAALGFGDIPPEAFAEALALIEVDGLVGFSIKETMIGAEDATGFSALVTRALDHGQLELARSRRYQHRLSMAGEPIHYIAMVAHKRGELLPETQRP